MGKKKKKKSKKEKKKKWTTVYETDEELHGNKKNTNKFCIGCKKIENCYTGKAAIVISCLEWEEDDSD